MILNTPIPAPLLQPYGFDGYSGQQYLKTEADFSILNYIQGLCLLGHPLHISFRSEKDNNKKKPSVLVYPLLWNSFFLEYALGASDSPFHWNFLKAEGALEEEKNSNYSGLGTSDCVCFCWLSFSFF